MSRLETYSVDDLHQMACAEHEDDQQAWRLLNDVYESLRREYILAVEAVRERAI